MSFHWEVVKFFDLGNFILSTKMDEATVIDMHKTQVTQTSNLLGTKTKIIFNISCDHLIVVTYEIRVFFEGAQKEVFSSIFKKAL
jgi:hypothetical protein